MAVDAATQPSKLRWGELDEDDAEDFDYLLPPKQVIGPDANGYKKVIEYRFNEDGNKVKITTTTRTRKLANARLSKSAIERRSWPKFGVDAREDAGNRLTMVSTEEILLERPRAPVQDNSMGDQLLDNSIPSQCVKVSFNLGSEKFVAQANTGLVSEQLVSVKEQSMSILKDFITKHNIPNDVPDEPDEVSSEEDEASVKPPVKKSKKLL